MDKSIIKFKAISKESSHRQVPFVERERGKRGKKTEGGNTEE